MIDILILLLIVVTPMIFNFIKERSENRGASPDKEEEDIFDYLEKREQKKPEPEPQNKQEQHQADPEIKKSKRTPPTKRKKHRDTQSQDEALHSNPEGVPDPIGRISRQQKSIHRKKEGAAKKLKEMTIEVERVKRSSAYATKVKPQSRNLSQLRQAVLWREVLGPPKASELLRHRRW